MQLTFWGVRGSYPVPGRRTTRYGGHTACVEVCTSDGERLVIDAGTGLRGLGQKLSSEQAGRPQKHDILLSHVHWDHIQGLPFFDPVYSEGSEITLFGLRSANQELRKVVAGITRRDFFPIALSAVPAALEFQEVQPEACFQRGVFSVTPFALNHPFGSLGYRIEAGKAAVAYVSDTAPFSDMLHKQHFVNALEPPSEEDRAVLAAMRRSVVQALEGVDTVVYDTQFLPEEYQRFPFYGHSTPDHALEICREASVRRLVLYHHAPSHDDDQMDRIAELYARRGSELGIEVVASYQGLTLSLLNGGAR
jgi:phosphoribosyl 1,2-cyclic phosphodiesterase